MSALFNGDDFDSDGEIKINSDYAKKYDTWRQNEELNKLKAKYGDIDGNATSDESSDTDSSSEEEEENELAQQFDKDFYKTLACLKKKDPRIYKQDVTFFDDTNKAQELYSEKKSTDKSKKEKAVYLRDYERKIILEREGKYSDSEDEDMLKQNKEKTNTFTYTQEQKQLKESFKGVLHDEEEEDAELLKPKSKSESEKQKEEADYKEWLKGQESNIDETEQETLKPLRDFWSNPNLDSNEKFLRDYVLNNKYLDKEYAGIDLNHAHMVYNDENLSEDEKNVEKQEEFEHKYNFRFEEPDQEFIKRYPRTMENSIRRKDTRRAQKRAEVKMRKAEEKLKKKEELKQLKALKRKEIEDKLMKLKEITGNEDIKFNDIDLDGDFDPTEYDKKMTEIFNDDYYAAPEDDIKPEFPEVDEELEIEDTWDNYDPNAENYEEEYKGPHCEDPDFNMDADYDASKSVQEEIEGTKKRRRRRKSKFAELIATKKPKFDPEQYKSYNEYFDKYYSLDYEDMIGDIPCRFKYRKVVPNNFGLSVEEILMADDKELNKWCSLKKALQYKPEHAELNDVQMYKQKAKNEALKQKILRSLYSPEDEEADKSEIANNSTTVSETTETKKNRPRKKKKKAQNVSFVAETNGDASINNNVLARSDKKISNNTDTTSKETKKKSEAEKRKPSDQQCRQPAKKKHKLNTNNETLDKAIDDESNSKQSKKAQVKGKMKKKFNKTKSKDFKQKEPNGDIASLNPERLKMYGINPKKLKNKLKYGTK
ncbi:protein KRI1 homolog [Hylaeus anthracinus]|uniref:protein KRI1 homolog n=1 Tax=Hylaeus anthracinus TaxID=313031 RepID=UPI0023B956DC|nr:protein KRI1 homolog [Hylaeus anthracinus]